MADLVMHCCECLEPMAPIGYPFALAAQRWFECPTHGYWDESEVGAVVFTLSAYETMRRDGASMLPVIGEAE